MAKRQTVNVKAYTRLKGKFREKGLVYQEAADHLGLTLNGFRNMINGKSDFRVHQLIAICEEYDLDFYYICNEFMSASQTN